MTVIIRITQVPSFHETGNFFVKKITSVILARLGIPVYGISKFGANSEVVQLIKNMQKLC